MTYDPGLPAVIRRWSLDALRFAAIAAVAASALAWAVPARAQSLGELARQEEARRKSVKKPAKVYTNSSLSPAPGEIIPTPSTPRPESAPPQTGGTEPPVQENPAAVEAPPDEKNTREYWRERIVNATSQRDRNALLIEALQSRINGLLADFTARDDPAQRTVIAGNRQKALDELARMQKEQIALDKAIADIEEEARRARIPPGWLR